MKFFKRLQQWVHRHGFLTCYVLACLPAVAVMFGSVGSLTWFMNWLGWSAWVVYPVTVFFALGPITAVAAFVAEYQDHSHCYRRDGSWSCLFSRLWCTYKEDLWMTVPPIILFTLPMGMYDWANGKLKNYCAGLCLDEYYRTGDHGALHQTPWQLIRKKW